MSPRLFVFAFNSFFSSHFYRSLPICAFFLPKPCTNDLVATIRRPSIVKRSISINEQKDGVFRAKFAAQENMKDPGMRTVYLYPGPKYHHDLGGSTKEGSAKHKNAPENTQLYSPSAFIPEAVCHNVEQASRCNRDTAAAVVPESAVWRVVLLKGFGTTPKADMFLDFTL